MPPGKYFDRIYHRILDLLSNVVTIAVKDLDEIQRVLRTFIQNGVKFCIHTGWPEVIEDRSLYRQYALLLENGIITDTELRAANQTAFAARFIPAPGLDAYL